MYIIADIITVAIVMITFLLRYIREGDDGDDDDDNENEDDENEDDERFGEINETHNRKRSYIVNTCKQLIMMLCDSDARCSTRQIPEKLSQQSSRNQKMYTCPFP
jgi:hypothetical protein